MSNGTSVTGPHCVRKSDSARRSDNRFAVEAPAAAPQDRTRPPEGRFISPDCWLSALLHKNVYRLSVPEESVTADRFADHEALCELKTAHPTFMYAKVPVHAVASVRCLVRLGFDLIDTNLTYEKPRVDNRVASTSGIRAALPQDEDRVVQIARDNFRYSRFHLDPQIAAPLADHIKGEWVRSFFRRNRGDKMLVATAGHQVAGFALLLDGPSDAVTIDLIAVDRPYRHRGVARDLITAAEQDSTCGVLQVGTQLANVPSIRLYESLGFRMARASYVFHCHTP